MSLLDDPRCAFDLEHLRAWGIMVYAQQFFDRRIMLAVAETGAYFEPVECSGDDAADLALLRLWVDIEMHAELYGLAFSVERDGFGADPTRVAVVDPDTGTVLASMPCDRETGPFVAHGVLRGLIVDALIDEDVEPIAMDPDTRWGMQHGIA